MWQIALARGLISVAFAEKLYGKILAGQPWGSGIWRKALHVPSLRKPLYKEEPGFLWECARCWEAPHVASARRVVLGDSVLKHARWHPSVNPCVFSMSKTFNNMCNLSYEKLPSQEALCMWPFYKCFTDNHWRNKKMHACKMPEFHNVWKVVRTGTQSQWICCRKKTLQIFCSLITLPKRFHTGVTPVHLIHLKKFASTHTLVMHNVQ